jgi:drug/metabolite transporter (DMT)-like permease
MSQPVAPGDGGERRRLIAGFAILLVCTSFFGAGPTMAALAFQGGADALTLQLCRFSFAFVAVATLSLALGWSPRVSRPQFLKLCGLAVCTSVSSFGYMTAVRYVPVPLATLSFFTFPIFVTLLLHVIGAERLTAARLTAVGVAFGGLILVFVGRIDSFDPVGVALGLGAGATVAVSFMITRSLAGQIRAPTMVLYSTGMPVLAYLVIVLAAGGPQFPVTAEGWIGTLGNGLSYVTGLACLYAAVARLGAFVTATAGNVEPLISIAIAWTVLGQSLSAPQIAGAAIVIGGILLIQRDRRAAVRK